MKIDIKDIKKIELDKDKEYIFVFSKKSGLSAKEIEPIQNQLPNWKISILLDNLNDLKVIEKK